MTEMLIKGLFETVYMVAMATFFAWLLGLPIGIILTYTDKSGLKPNRIVYSILNSVVNVGRSIPFIIMMVALIPFTALIVGTSIGPTAAVVSLTIAATPLVGRLVENSLKEVDKGIIDAAVCMRATTYQMVVKVYLKESIPALIRNVSVVMVNIVGYSAMAGALGGGGLGDIAVRYGFYRFDTKTMLITLVIIIGLTQFLQVSFEYLAKKIDKIGGI